jgi:nucleotide-binding universal stress UspA family protein
MPHGRKRHIVIKDGVTSVLSKLQEVSFMRVIQIPVANRPECVTALGLAFTIAKQVGADVRGVHIRPHRDMPPNLPIGAGLRQNWVDTADWIRTTEKEAEEQSISASSLFEKIATSNGYAIARKPRKDLTPVAFWQERVGNPDHIMPIIGPTADMMVVSRPAKKGGQKAKVFLMQALMNSHRPVLVVPPKPVKSIAKHIAIAWNGSGEAARIVHGALPLLKSADKVTLVSVGPMPGVGPSATEMAHFLSHHGIAAGKLSIRRGVPEEELSNACSSIGADLLAMGAYSRNRISEVLFGGVTQHMMFHTNLPVLLLHS